MLYSENFVYFPSLPVEMAMCSFRDSKELGGRESEPLLRGKGIFLRTMLLVWIIGIP